MRIPIMRGLIDRRILVNYRVDPEVLAVHLPPPFRPKLVHGMGMAGICLIRLKQVRPRGCPAWLGITSENAAHRIAVEWDDATGVREGVFVRRRDTSSRLNVLAGGRLFPGIHHRAKFVVRESERLFSVALVSGDKATDILVRGSIGNEMPDSSIFSSLAECTSFFQAGSLGYSATPDVARFQGLELRCFDWRITPLSVDELRSSFFDDRTSFPSGSIAFDSALLMRGIEHEWRGHPDLRCCQEDLVAAT